VNFPTPPTPLGQGGAFVTQQGLRHLGFKGYEQYSPFMDGPKGPPLSYTQFFNLFTPPGANRWKAIISTGDLCAQTELALGGCFPRPFFISTGGRVGPMFPLGTKKPNVSKYSPPPNVVPRASWCIPGSENRIPLLLSNIP